MFTGCGTALVTPFHPDGSVDEAAMRRLVRRLDLSARDAPVVLGMLRQILWKLKQ